MQMTLKCYTNNDAASNNAVKLQANYMNHLCDLICIPDFLNILHNEIYLYIVEEREICHIPPRLSNAHWCIEKMHSTPG